MGTGNIRGPPCKVYDYLTTNLYTWNYYKVILNVNGNWKIKFKNLPSTHSENSSILLC